MISIAGGGVRVDALTLSCSNLTRNSSNRVHLLSYSNLTPTSSNLNLTARNPSFNLRPVLNLPPSTSGVSSPPATPFAIWGIEEPLKKVASLLLLTAVLLLSNPLSAQARIAPAIRHVLLRSVREKMDREEKMDTKTEELGLGDKIAVVAICVSVAIFLNYKVWGGGQRTVLQLRFQYPWTSPQVGRDIILEYNQAKRAARKLLPGAYSIWVNDLMRIVLTHQDHCISSSSFACVKESDQEALVMLTHLRAEQDAKLKESMIDVTPLNPKESNSLHIVITVYLVLTGNQKWSSMNGSESVKDLCDNILSIPWGDIERIVTNMKYWEVPQ